MVNPEINRFVSTKLLVGMLIVVAANGSALLSVVVS